MNTNTGPLPLETVRAFSRRAYARLAFGLSLASASAWFIENRLETAARFFGDPGAQWAVILTAVAAALTLGGWNNKRTSGLASDVLLVGWSVLCGAASALLFQTRMIAVSGALLSAAAGFAAAALYARLLKGDPLSVGGTGLSALAGLTLATLVDWNPARGPYDGLAAFLAVFAFVAVSAWDVERVRRAALSPDDPDASGAALALWLDVVNRPLARVCRMASTGLRPATHGNLARFAPHCNNESEVSRRSHVHLPAAPHPRSRRPVGRVRARL